MDDYQALSDAYLRLLTADSNTCLELGLEERLNELPDPSLEAFLARRKQAEQLLELEQD